MLTIDKKLLVSIILSLGIGIMIGWNLVIPKEIILGIDDSVIDFTENMETISENINQACHNLTYECICNFNDSSNELKATNIEANPIFINRLK